MKNIFLLLQKLPKEVHVATRALILTCINWIKAPFFVLGGVVTAETPLTSLKFMAHVPVGVVIEVWLNRRFSGAAFI